MGGRAAKAPQVQVQEGTCPTAQPQDSGSRGTLRGPEEPPKPCWATSTMAEHPASRGPRCRRGVT